MWVSIPLSDQEMEWLIRLGGAWRENRDGLFRQSGVELALVTQSVWQHWDLPKSQGPILTLDSVDRDELNQILTEGAEWIRPISATSWGSSSVGFVRFPSGVLLEIKQEIGGADHAGKSRS